MPTVSTPFRFSSLYFRPYPCIFRIVERSRCRVLWVSGRTSLFLENDATVSFLRTLLLSGGKDGSADPTSVCIVQCSVGFRAAALPPLVRSSSPKLLYTLHRTIRSVNSFPRTQWCSRLLSMMAAFIVLQHFPRVTLSCNMVIVGWWRRVFGVACPCCGQTRS